MKNNIYFDYNATTPADRRIVDAIVPLYLEQFGNPSNMNSAYGKEADRAYKSALRTIADYFMVESINVRCHGIKQPDFAEHAGGCEKTVPYHYIQNRA